jgi:hypothetical protein
MMEIEDEEDYDVEDGAYVPTEEEERAAQQYFEYSLRHPTFLMVMKAVTRRARLLRLRALEAPEMILEAEEKLINEALDALCEALPFDVEAQAYSLPGIVHHFQDELLRPPERRGPGEEDA